MAEEERHGACYTLLLSQLVRDICVGAVVLWCGAPAGLQRSSVVYVSRGREGGTTLLA